MVSDNEPRYWLRDSNGTIVGSLYAKADGTLALQEGTSGSDNEVTFATGGTLTVDAVDATTTLTDPSGTDHTGELMDVGDPPTAHAASHAEGSSDPLDVGTLVDFDPEEFLIGTAANRPAAGTANRLYLSTDTAGGPVIERDTGSAWEVVAASTGALEDTGYAELNVGGLSGDLADAQDPKAHAITHGADSADEVFAESLGTAGADGTVPTSQGDGTLSMQSAGGSNVPDYTQDGTLNNSGSSSYTYTLNDQTFDEVLIKFQQYPDSNDLVMRINGDGGSTTNYAYVTRADSQTSSASEWDIPDRFDGGDITMTTQTAFDVGYSQRVSGSSTGVAVAGDYTGGTASINSFSLIDTTASNFPVQAIIYGWSGGLS